MIRKRDGWWLHVPFAKRVEIQGKAEDRRQAESDLTVGTIALNADSAVAAAWEGVRCRAVRTIGHARENAKREKALQKVAHKPKPSGRPVQGEHSHMGLGRYIAALDSAVAWQGVAAIVTWAWLACTCWSLSTYEHTGRSEACHGVDAPTVSVPAGFVARCWSMYSTLRFVS